MIQGLIALCLVAVTAFAGDLTGPELFENLYQKSRFGGPKTHAPVSVEKIIYSLNFGLFGDSLTDQKFIEDFLTEALANPRTRDAGRLEMMVAYLAQKKSTAYHNYLTPLAREAQRNGDQQILRFIFVYASGDAFLDLLSYRPYHRFSEIVAERLERTKTRLIQAVNDMNQDVIDDELKVVHMILAKMESFVGPNVHTMGRLHRKIIQMLKGLPAEHPRVAELLKIYETRDAFSGQKSVYALKDCRYYIPEKRIRN